MGRGRSSSLRGKARKERGHGLHCNILGWMRGEGGGIIHPEIIESLAGESP